MRNFDSPLGDPDGEEAIFYREGYRDAVDDIEIEVRRRLLTARSRTPMFGRVSGTIAYDLGQILKQARLRVGRPG